MRVQCLDIYETPHWLILDSKDPLTCYDILNYKIILWIAAIYIANNLYNTVVRNFWDTQVPNYGIIVDEMYCHLGPVMCFYCALDDVYIWCLNWSSSMFYWFVFYSALVFPNRNAYFAYTLVYIVLVMPRLIIFNILFVFPSRLLCQAECVFCPSILIDIDKHALSCIYYDNKSLNTVENY